MAQPHQSRLLELLKVKFIVKSLKKSAWMSLLLLKVVVKLCWERIQLRSWMCWEFDLRTHHKHTQSQVKELLGTLLRTLPMFFSGVGKLKIFQLKFLSDFFQVPEPLRTLARKDQQGRCSAEILPETERSANPSRNTCLLQEWMQGTHCCWCWSHRHRSCPHSATRWPMESNFLCIKKSYWCGKEIFPDRKRRPCLSMGLWEIQAVRFWSIVRVGDWS